MRPDQIDAGVRHGSIVLRSSDLFKPFPRPTEVGFPLRGSTNALLLEHDGQLVHVDAGRRTGELLSMASNRVPTLAIAIGDADSLVIDLRTFADETRIDHLAVTVPDEVRQLLGDHLGTEVDDATLVEEYVITSLGTAADRIVATTGGDDQSGFGLQGRSTELHVRMDDGVLRAHRVVGRPDRHRVERHRLLVGAFSFANRSEPNDTATSIRLQDSFTIDEKLFELWDLYNRLEIDHIKGVANDIGKARHGRPVERHDGTTEFPVPAAEHQRFLELLERDGARLDLISTPDGVSREFVNERDLFRGRIEFVDPQARRVIVRPVSNKMERPPPDGWLTVATAGGEVQARRRTTAFQRLVDGRTMIPGVASILRERPAPARRPAKRHRPVSPALTSSFPGTLTDKQRQAIDVAINTPDIAIIQGPPGTGKSQVIAAIQQRLAEIGETSPRMILLTSVQHDAVDQIAARTRIFGLPPHRFGRRREGVEDPIQVWRRERIAALAHLREGASTTLTSQWLTEVIVAHRQAPSGPAGTASLLRSVDERCGPSLTDALRDKMAVRAEELERPALNPSRSLRLERIIRSVRTTATSYSDDGPARLADLLRVVGSFSGTWKETWHDRIAALVDATTVDLEVIRELRSEMLDEIVATTSSIRDDIVDAVAERLLKAAAAELARDDKRPVTVEETIERYLIDLEVYPGAVEQALREYTAVWASTCQGAATSVNDSWRVSAGGANFPTVIVDEAARANPLDLLIPVTQASERVILVGDHRQLPQVIDEQLRDSMVTTSGEATDGELLETSLYERLFRHVRRLEIESGVQRAVTLDQQFRMHPDLAAFVSNSFYAPHGESFTSGVSAEAMLHQVSSFEGQVAGWLDVPAEAGSAQRLDTGSWEREPEVDKVVELVDEILASPGNPSVGVITFYAGQRDRILEALLPKRYTEIADEGIVVAREWRYQVTDDGREVERLRIGTVDSFQGKEFDVVILSMVRSTKKVEGRTPRGLFGFLTSENRFCVAVSRQRRLLLVVGDRSMVDHDPATEIVGLRELAQLCGDPR
jgi:hypothetical protein